MYNIPAESIENLLDALPRARPGTAGVIHTASTPEVALGTDASKAVTPQALAESRYFAQADRNGVSRSIPANAWTQVGASNETSDPQKVYDANTSFYTAAATGLYVFIAMLRLADGATADQIGFTVDTSGRDGSFVVWGDRAATGNRYTISLIRVMPLTAGQSVAMYAYSPSVARTISNASITAFRL